MRGLQVALLLLLVMPLALATDELSYWGVRGLARVLPKLTGPAPDLLPDLEVPDARSSQITVKDEEEEEKALSSSSLVFVFITVCLLPALGEELFFRGYLGRALVARHGPVLGAIFASVVFGLSHGSVDHMIGAALTGVGLHGIYLATRSFWAPVLLHALNNLWAHASISLRLTSRAIMNRSHPAPFLPILVALAASLVVAALGWAIYQTRTRWALPDGTEWDGGAGGVEAPPPSLGAMPFSDRLGATSLLVAGAYLVFGTVFLLALQAGSVR
jgi:membrane protease YdiL (CAAX protease family)